MRRLWIILMIVAGFSVLGCSPPEENTSSPDNYMSEGSSMEPDPEIVKQKEEQASRSVDTRGAGGMPTKGGE